MQVSSASSICKILLVFLLFCLTKASGGTCLSYGHSCWGGHGKRNGVGHLTGPTNSQKRTSELYISRLFNPSIGSSKQVAAIFKSPNPNAKEVDKFRQYRYQINPMTDNAENNPRIANYRDEDLENDSKLTKWVPDTSESEEEVILLSPEDQQGSLSKYGQFQFLNQDSNKRQEN